MRIVIDARLYGIEHRGLGRYTECLLNELVRLPAAAEYIILIDPKNKTRPQNLPANFRLMAVPVRVYSLAEQFILPLVLLILKPALVHFTHFNAPYFVPSKYILTVHDLIINHFPDSRASHLPKWLYQIKLGFYFKIIKHNIAKAEHVITVSKFVANDINQQYGVPLTKITPIYLATNLPPIVNCLEKLPAKYFLYVGAAYPHKNLKCLIQGFLIFKSAHPEYTLVVVGKKDSFMSEVMAEYQEPSQSGNIVFWGEASDEALSCLYQNSQAYVTATLMEGFGLGPLEAASFGKISIVTDIPVFREIYKQDLIYFRPNDYQDIAEKLSDYVKLSPADIKPKMAELNYLLSSISWLNNALAVNNLYNQILTTTKN